MKKTLLILAAIMLITVSCDKNQKAVKLLNGKWKLTSIETKVIETGSAIVTAATDDYITELEFDNCKLKNNEFCTVTTIITEDNDDPIYGVSVYKVSGDGTTLEQGNSKYDEDLGTFSDIQAPNTYAVYGDILMDTILQGLKPLMED